MKRTGSKPVVAVTMGDYNGIGPEIVLKSVLSPSIRAICIPLVIGSIDAFEWYAHRLGIRTSLKEISEIPSHNRNGIVPVFNLRRFQRPAIRPGKCSGDAGSFAGDAIEVAAGLCLQGITGAMVTAPVSKEALHLAGFRFPGQTEMLGSLCGNIEPTMMLVAGSMRVALATIHIPLKKVSSSLSVDLFRRKIAAVGTSLRIDYGIRRPKIALLGVNPHAGENGDIGDEEQTILQPAIRSAGRNGLTIRGPFPADGFFGTGAHTAFDAILAAYHDQGLIPLKMTGFEYGVNFSAGLPIVRTSPDHGTAFDIAGKGAASPSSMMAAIRLAVSIAENRGRRT